MGLDEKSKRLLPFLKEGILVSDKFIKKNKTGIIFSI
jgi:hypothetical protein